MLGYIAEARRPAACHGRVSAFGGTNHSRERPSYVNLPPFPTDRSRGNNSSEVVR